MPHGNTIQANTNRLPPKPSAPLTMGDVAGGYATATLKRPNSYMPDWMTGSLPHALLMSGLGGVAGHYALPKLLSWLDPRINEEKAKKIGGPLGALLGLGVAAPNLYSTFQAARGVGGDRSTGYLGPWQGGFKGLYSDLNNIPGRAENLEQARQVSLRRPSMVKEQSVKSAIFNEGFWATPSINPASFTNAARSALYHGKADPTSALQAVTAAEEAAGNQEGGYITPLGLGSAAANAMIRAGVGAGVGFALGKVVGALGGAFGLLSPEAQSRTGRTGALVGAIGNIITGSNAFRGL